GSKIGPDDTIVTKARVVYVAPTSGSPIPAGSQVAVVGNLADMGDNIELRFADVRDDAIDLDAEGEPVRDDGALLVVGKVPEKRPPVDVSVEVYFNSSTQHDYTLRISRRDGTYVVTQATENE
ncbi:MAG TPA: hypothetical protein PLV68_16970, partial [Ilumatobacteraceae bacterium]|nr:hypothetical protein [Ilumatobacteraceae bacterium]